MDLIVTSDTHIESRHELPDLPMEGADLVIHAGDFTSEEAYEGFSEYNLRAVHGNADAEELKARLPSQDSFEVEEIRVVVVHGHQVSSDQELRYKGLEMGADLLIHGHTHSPSFVERGIGLLNPGSPTQPRGSPPTYAEVKVEEKTFEVSVIDV
ncbi:MAG: metallophosphoesterase [Halobacteria archaeon]|nr:metallophosphoesterase [Halobacteria archaeon]